MTTPSTYNKEVFEQLYELCMGEWMKGAEKPVIQMRDDGAFAELADCETLDWTPSCDLMKPGSADPLTAPLIPFPFTASHLAAFMLDGWGCFMREACGDWETGPDEAMLRRIPVRGGKVKEALCGAYDAYREAESIVGKLDPTFQAKTQQLDAQYTQESRLARLQANFREPGIEPAEYKKRHASYKAAIAKLGKRMKQAQRQSDEAHSVWRKAMVNQLLLQMDLAIQDSLAGARPLSLTTGDIAKRQTWRDVAFNYLVKTFKAGQYATAKDFYKALEKDAGTDGSPFDKGVGQNFDSLFVRDIAKSLSFKTLGNALPEIRKAAKKG